MSWPHHQLFRIIHPSQSMSWPWFLCLPRLLPPSAVPWRVTLERVSRQITWWTQAGLLSTFQTKWFLMPSIWIFLIFNIGICFVFPIQYAQSFPKVFVFKCASTLTKHFFLPEELSSNAHETFFKNKCVS